MLARWSLLVAAGLVGCASLIGIDEATVADSGASSSSGSSDASFGPEAQSSGAASSSSSSSGVSSSGELEDAGNPVGDLAYAAWPMPQPSPAADDYAATAEVVFDEVTKLTWQRVVPAAPMHRADAEAYCNGLSLDGRDDWRLPSRMELVSLLDVAGTTSPRIQQAAFPDTPSDSFWSQSRAWAMATMIPQSWAVHFGSGHVSAQSQDESEPPHRVRCVRGMDQISPVPQHWEVHEGTVRDRSTGLLWLRAPQQGFGTLADAAFYCQSRSQDGESGFRLPTLRELLSLIAEREPAGSGGLDGYAFPAGGPHPAWTVSPAVGSTDVMTVDVSLGGTTGEDDPASENAAVRCVK